MTRLRKSLTWQNSSREARFSTHKNHEPIKPTIHKIMAFIRSIANKKMPSTVVKASLTQSASNDTKNTSGAKFFVRYVLLANALWSKFPKCICTFCEVMLGFH